MAKTSQKQACPSREKRQSLAETTNPLGLVRPADLLLLVPDLREHAAFPGCTAAHPCLSRYFAQHLRIGRKFAQKREESLDRFRRPMAGQTASNRVDLLEIALGQQ
jgi:hypothetical protein